MLSLKQNAEQVYPKHIQTLFLALMKMLIVQKRMDHNAEMLRERDELEIYLSRELKLVLVSSELLFVLEYNSP